MEQFRYLKTEKTLLLEKILLFAVTDKTKPGWSGLQCTTLTVVPAADCIAAMKAKETTAPAGSSNGTTGAGTSASSNTTTTAAAPPKGVICTRNLDGSCGGDQGSPVFSNKTGSLALVGVVSLYPDTRPNARCKDGHMVVVTQLGSFKNFIINPTAPSTSTS